MTVTVVSACFGSYDQPAVPLEQDCDVTWVMVTDGNVDVPAPWVECVEPHPEMHPRLAAKIPKVCPHRYANSDVAIWLDASASILRPDFVSTCVQALGDGDVAQWVHPQRDCIIPEANVSATMLKYQGVPVQAQAHHYIANGHPWSFGLWATGCMVWAAAACEDELVGDAWFAEQYRWTYQDQLSWPVIVRQFRLDVRPLPGGLWDKTYLAFRPHASDQ